MNKPKIRFKGFEGEWKEMQFEVAFEYQRNNSLSRAELSDEGIVANIHYGDVLIKYGECLDVSKDVLTYVKDKKISMALYKKGALRNGDVIFADAAEDNTVGKCTEVICEENVCIVSGLHTIACRPQVEFVERYLGYSLNSPSFHNQLLPHIQGTKISSISKNALSSTSISLPSLPEQRAIASYFTSLDAQIAASTSRLSSLKQIKAASLLNMFPQKGEMVPRVRFKGFEGEWKERKLGEVCLVNRGVRITRKDLSNAEGYPVFQNTNYPLGFYQYYNVEAKNPFVIIGGSAGLIGFSNKEFWAADDYVYFKDKEETDKSFLYNILCSHEAEIKKEVRGSSVPRLDRSILEKLRINLPSLPEQRAIASYFTTLDAQITLQRERLEKLKQIKAACLEKMFA
uniref:restriction endonuclease subunit S n=1 Tax=Alloprevotella sp. TaxID=1872471 RepID=UPI003FF08B00